MSRACLGWEGGNDASTAGRLSLTKKQREHSTAAHRPERLAKRSKLVVALSLAAGLRSPAEGAVEKSLK